jgi:hypothetical protein
MSELERSLNGVRRRLVRHRLLRAALGGAVIVGAGWLLLMLADRWWHLPMGVRRGGAALAAVAAGSAAWLRMRRFPSLDEVEVARWLERRSPGLRELLVSAVQLRAEGGRDPAFNSPELVGLVVEEAERRSEALSWSRLRPRGKLRRVVRLAGGTALIWLMALGGSASMRRAFGRLWLDLPWPQRTHLLLSYGPGGHGDPGSGGGPVPKGEALEIRAVPAEGSHQPSEARVRCRPGGIEDGRSATEVEMNRYGDGHFEWVFPNVRASLLFQVSSDDFTSAWVPVAVAERPGIVSLEAVLDYPDYTGWPDAPALSEEGVGSGDLRALFHTVVRVAGEANKPLRAASIRFVPRDGNGESPAVPLGLSESGTGFRGAFTMERDGYFHFALEDTDGLVDPEPVRHAVRVTADRSPEVRLLAPGEDLKVLPQARVPVGCSFLDDVGLREGRLLVRRGSAEEPLPISAWQAPPPGVGGRESAHLLELEKLGVRPGELLRLRGEGVDGDTESGPKRGYSEERLLTVVGREEFEQSVDARLAGLRQQIDRLAEEQAGAREGTARLLDLLERPEFSGVRQGELVKQRDVQEGTRRALSGIERLLDLLEMNRIDPGDRERALEEAASRLGEADRGSLEGAAGRLQESGAAGEPARIALKEALGLQEKALDALEEASRRLGRAQTLTEVIIRTRRLSGFLDEILKEIQERR